MAGKAEEAVDVRARPEDGRLMLEPEVEARPWAEQRALDDASYRAQLAYLFERSPFYREKLAAAGFAIGRARPAGSTTSRALPLTEKHELRATRAPRQPVRRAPLRRAVGDRPDLLDERHHRHAELHPADRGRPRQLGRRARRAATRRPASPPASASSRPTTPGRSWPARRSPRSTASASVTSRSAPATPSG